MKEITWIVYCPNRDCGLYLDNKLLGLVVPPIAEGMEDMIDLYCEACEASLEKIKDEAIFIA